jgi:hypothetical protein
VSVPLTKPQVVDADNLRRSYHPLGIPSVDECNPWEIHGMATSRDEQNAENSLEDAGKYCSGHRRHSKVNVM